MDFAEEHQWTAKQRSLIIGAVIVAVLIVVAAGVFGYQWYQRSSALKGVEQVQDLGFGFRRVTIAKQNKFEMGHYPFLYYQNRLLCQIGAGSPPSISPSGNFAACQDSRTGKLILFRRRDERLTDLTTSFIGIVRSYAWHEDQDTVEAEIAGAGMSAVFPLK